MNARKAAIAALAIFAVSMGACRVERGEEGRVEDVDLDSAAIPDVDLPDVDVSMDSAQVPVPRVEINRDTTRDTTRTQ